MKWFNLFFYNRVTKGKTKKLVSSFSNWKFKKTRVDSTHCIKKCTFKDFNRKVYVSWFIFQNLTIKRAKKLNSRDRLLLFSSRASLVLVKRGQRVRHIHRKIVLINQSLWNEIDADRTKKPTSNDILLLIFVLNA